MLWWRVEPVVPRKGGMQGFDMQATPAEINRQADKWARSMGARVRVRIIAY